KCLTNLFACSLSTSFQSPNHALILIIINPSYYIDIFCNLTGQCPVNASGLMPVYSRPNGLLNTISDCTFNALLRTINICIIVYKTVTLIAKFQTATSSILNYL